MGDILSHAKFWPIPPTSLLTIMADVSPTALANLAETHLGLPSSTPVSYFIDAPRRGAFAQSGFNESYSTSDFHVSISRNYVDT
jgi:hypothetical protein